MPLGSFRTAGGIGRRLPPSGPLRSAKTITRFGNTEILTNQSKFGGSSIYFDGNGDYIKVSASDDFKFGTNNFTVGLRFLYINI